jgi:hypothetical protein
LDDIRHVIGSPYLHRVAVRIVETENALAPSLPIGRVNQANAILEEQEAGVDILILGVEEEVTVAEGRRLHRVFRPPNGSDRRRSGVNPEVAGEQDEITMILLDAEADDVGVECFRSSDVADEDDGVHKRIVSSH